jgi:hypothetical protein
MRQMPPIMSPVKERQELGLHHLQTPRENQTMSKEHATQSHLSKLEKDVMELNACNEYLRQKLGKLDARIRHLIRLGLATTRPEALDQWQEEEEL